MIFYVGLAVVFRRRKNKHSVLFYDSSKMLFESDN